MAALLRNGAIFSALIFLLVQNAVASQRNHGNSKSSIKNQDLLSSKRLNNFYGVTASNGVLPNILYTAEKDGNKDKQQSKILNRDEYNRDFYLTYKPQNITVNESYQQNIPTTSSLQNITLQGKSSLPLSLKLALPKFKFSSSPIGVVQPLNRKVPLNSSNSSLHTQSSIVVPINKGPSSPSTTSVSTPSFGITQAISNLQTQNPHLANCHLCQNSEYLNSIIPPQTNNIRIPTISPKHGNYEKTDLIPNKEQFPVNIKNEYVQQPPITLQINTPPIDIPAPQVNLILALPSNNESSLLSKQSNSDVSITPLINSNPPYVVQPIVIKKHKSKLNRWLPLLFSLVFNDSDKDNVNDDCQCCCPCNNCKTQTVPIPYPVPIPILMNSVTNESNE